MGRGTGGIERGWGAGLSVALGPSPGAAISAVVGSREGRTLALGPLPEPNRWGARGALGVLLAGTATLYIWGVGSSGWAFRYYAAAVQAGAWNWKAMFFGSLDPGNFITVAKPPAAFWVMELSARLFGLSPWSMLVPQALEGAATVALVYLTVRRWSGVTAGLVAGSVTALCPVSVALFRYDNPDSLLVLAVVATAYATTRGIESGRVRWSLLAGALLGVAFLAKMNEALLVVPGIAGAYALAAPGAVSARLRQMLCAAGSFAATAGWWLVAVWVTPAGDRPYIGNTSDNNVFSLVAGYNGLDRLTGSNTQRWAGSSSPDLLERALRLFGTEIGSQVAWLLPAAGLLAIGGLVVSRGGRRDLERSAIVLWGGWLLVVGTILSFGEGEINPYYTLLLAPALGALVALGTRALWQQRALPQARWGLAGASALTAIWAFDLLDRSRPWHPWVRETVLLAGVVSFIGLVRWDAVQLPARAAVVVLTAWAALAGPVCYDVGTVLTPISGNDPYATLALATPKAPADSVLGCTSKAVVARLSAAAGAYRWSGAVVGAAAAAGYQLATEKSMMAIGGWDGTDPVPTLATFKTYVARGQVRYFISAGPCGGLDFGRAHAGSDAAKVTSWVERSFTATPVGGLSVYDLAQKVGR